MRAGGNLATSRFCEVLLLDLRLPRGFIEEPVEGFLLLLAVLFEGSELETPQRTQDFYSFLLDSGAIRFGKALKFGKNSRVLVAGHQLVQLSRWECLCELRVAVHLEETEELGGKRSRSIASVYSLTISTWVCRSVVLVVDGVASVSSVSPMLRRGISLIYMEINELESRMESHRSLTDYTETLGTEVVVTKGRKTCSNACITKSAQYVRADQMWPSPRS